ncbi:hypothetical protein [Fibrivirga algicola]|uniref:RHS repeat protein n=1 Tax=Fibrivirga algicola TaxID=2950420 RepID=A0ABX0QGL4_9BACT|nr:hypothetical protein [Fibrivirga algicola]NID10207.1 hypothetical protein [Fibrivirga algicola]
MMKRYLILYRILTVLILSGLVGCHQTPLVPVTAIPLTCQLYQLTTINEGIRDTTTYLYNDFGHVLESSYRKWVNAKLATRTKKSFTYSYDHFLLTQIEQTTNFLATGGQTQDDKGYVYDYIDGKINKVVIRNNVTGVTILVQQYQYENDVVKTVTELNGTQLLLRRYMFTSDAKLVKYEEPSLFIITEVNNGKITKKVGNNGTTINYQFDNQGQLINETTTSASEQTIHLYDYDTAQYWGKTQLRLRGFPVIDFGGASLLHNLLVDDLQVIQNGRVTQKRKLTFNHIYTKGGYSLGYGRSDGAQQRNTYSNCL